MKVAALSDIHGNHYALQEVLKVAKKMEVELLLILGDLVGYYYSPEKVISLLKEWNTEMIKGNHEIILQQLHDGYIDDNTIRKKYGSGHRKALQNLTEEELSWLFKLPEQKTVRCANTIFQLNHGSPSSIDEYLYPDYEASRLEKCNSEDHHFVLVGHSHYSFVYNCKSSTLINCGSVGQSRQKGGLANWVFFNCENRVYQMMSTYYDPSMLSQEVKELDPDFLYGSNVLLR